GRPGLPGRVRRRVRVDVAHRARHLRAPPPSGGPVGPGNVPAPARPGGRRHGLERPGHPRDPVRPGAAGGWARRRGRSQRGDRGSGGYHEPGRHDGHARGPVLRVLVTGGFLLVSAGVIWLAFLMVPESSAGNLFTNLGTEIIGIVITVAFVEWMFERRRLQNRGRQLAWDALHAVEQVVWVWQGGPRQMDTDEILGVLDAVGDSDPVPDFTEGMLLGIGTRSRRLLDHDPQAVGAVPGFMN